MKALLLIASLLLGTLDAPSSRRQVRDERDAFVEVALATIEGVVLRDQVAGGTHWRLLTPNGPVHVWRPPGFDPKTAGVLVYLHGYYTDADEAFEHHRLGEQFRDSRRNALFVVPEAPVSNLDRVRFESLVGLLDTVRSQTKLRVPDGPVVVVGHSGGFRTIVSWLASPLIEQVILLDALYNNEADFAAWLRPTPKSAREHRIVLVGFETAERTEQFLASLGGAFVRESIPEQSAQFRRRDRQARVLYIRSQYGHMELVTEGKTLPLLLRLTQLKPL
jgi:hypothetical protein